MHKAKLGSWLHREDALALSLVMLPVSGRAPGHDQYDSRINVPAGHTHTGSLDGDTRHVFPSPSLNLSFSAESTWKGS